MLLPAYLKPDTASIKENIPLLASRHIVLVFDDSLKAALGPETVSYVYRTGPDGRVTQKAALKGLSLHQFRALIEPRPTPNKTDTLRFGGSFPLRPSTFQANAYHYLVQDGLSGGLYFIDRKGAAPTSWQQIQPRSLRKDAYRAYLRTDSVDAYLDELDLIGKNENIGMRGTVVAASLSGPEIHFLTKYLVPIGNLQSNFIAAFQYSAGQYSGPWLEPEDTRYDSLGQAFFGAVQTKPHTLKPLDPDAAYQQQERYAAASQVAFDRRQVRYEFNNTHLYYQGAGNYVFTVHDLDSPSRYFAAGYHRDSSGLTRDGLVPLRKPAIYPENGLGANFSTLAGQYPWVMSQIANVLYNLESRQTYLLPLSLGDYNYSAGAMRQLQPKMGLFVSDVVPAGPDAVKVLYTHAGAPYKVLHYNLQTGKVLSDAAVPQLSSGGNALLRFDGDRYVARIDPECRCIVRYPL